MTFKMAAQAQTLTVFNFSADTNEYIGSGDAYMPPHTGLPAHCTDIQPPEITPGSVAVFDEKTQVWTLVEDHRGKTVYNMLNGESMYIPNLGPLPVNTVSVSPVGQFQKWDGSKWVTDADAEKATQLTLAQNQKSHLMQIAGYAISPLQDAIDLEEATEDESVKLIAWKKYRVLLMRVDTSTAPEVEWPTPPEQAS